MTFSLLGVDIQTGEHIQLSRSARRQGLYLIGSSGTGKSGLIEHLVLEDIKQGLGVCLLDPHGDLVETILKHLPSREQDIILLDSSDEEFPCGLNLLACEEPPSYKVMQTMIEQTMHLFDLLSNHSPLPAHLSYALRNGIQTLLAHPGYTLAELPLLFTDGPLRAKLLTTVRDPNVRQFWMLFEAMTAMEQMKSTSELLQRLNVFLGPLTRNIVGQRSTLDFRSIIDQRKILLVRLSSLLPEMTSLIGTTLLAQLLSAALSRSDIEMTKRKQFNLYADEFQRFATQDVAKLIEEARKFGMTITIAHQRRSQLTGEVKEAVSTMANLVVFRVNRDDAQDLAEQFPLTPRPAELRREEKLTPIKTPATWVVQGHPHSHPDVQAFLNRFPLPRENERHNLFRAYEDALNQLLYEATISPTPLSVLGQLANVQLLLSIMQYHDTSLSTFYPLSAAAPRHQIDLTEKRYKRPSPDFGVHYVLSFWKWPPEYVQDAFHVEELLAPLFGAPDEQHFEQAATAYANYVEWMLTTEVKAHLAEYTAAQTEEQKARLQAAFDDLMVPLKWDQNREERRSRYLYAREIGTVADEAERCQDIYRYWTTVEQVAFENFVKEVRACVLALHQEPILRGSGVYEIVPVGQMSSAELADLAANELTTLPDYTAKVRIKDMASERIVEHTMRTVEPERTHAVWGEALQQRMARIHAQNLRDGVVRPREEVEEEMRRRQALDSSSIYSLHSVQQTKRERE